MTVKSNRTRLTLLILAILVLFYIGVQTFIAYQYADLSEQTEKRFKAIQASSIDERKKLEETIALGIENSRKELFWATFVTNISATIGVLVAFASIWMGFRQYIQTQEKQQLERSKERHDRIALELNTPWQGITSENPTKRAGSAAGLQDLLTPDKADFHRRAASALALLGRMPPQRVGSAGDIKTGNRTCHEKPVTRSAQQRFMAETDIAATRYRKSKYDRD